MLPLLLVLSIEKKSGTDDTTKWQAFHYMVGAAGGKKIPCAGYATFGTQELSDEILDALGETYSGCLMANHGMVRPAISRIILTHTKQNNATTPRLQFKFQHHFESPHSSSSSSSLEDPLDLWSLEFL